MNRKAKTKCDLKIIDDFLQEDKFKRVQDMFNHEETSWFYTPGISDDDSSAKFSSNNPLDNFMFAHMIYAEYLPRSNAFQELNDILKGLNQSLLRNLNYKFQLYGSENMIKKKIEKYKRLIKVSEIINCDSYIACLLYTSPSPRDKRQDRMPSSA